MYAIVEFLCTKEVEIVPESWMLEAGKCVWPPFKSTSRITKAVSTEMEPGNNWPTFAIRKMYITDSYSKARSKLKLAEDTSDLATDASDHECGNAKRKRKENSKYFSSESEDEAPEDGFVRRELNVPAMKAKGGPPAVPLFIPNISGTPVERPPQTPAPCGSSSLMITNFREPQTNTRIIGNSQERREEPQRTSTPVTCISATERNILQLLEEIKANVRSNTQLLQLLINNGGGNNRQDSSRLPEDIRFPMNTIEDVNNVEKKLEDGWESQMVSYLGCIGGATVEDTTRRILLHCISTELAKLMNWAGKNGKLAFMSLRLKTVISRAVRKNPITASCQDSDIETVVKNWLRYAKDRDGGRKRRAMEKRAVPENNN